MLFESKVKRAYWVSACLGTVPDFLIAAGITYYLDAEWYVALLLWLALQLLYLVIWIKDSATAWFVFKILGRKQLASAFLHYLQEQKFPEPEGYQKSADYYFLQLVEDASKPVETRIAAAGQFAALRFPANYGLIQLGVRLEIAYEDALQAYKQTFMPRIKA